MDDVLYYDIFQLYKIVHGFSDDSVRFLEKEFIAQKLTYILFNERKDRQFSFLITYGLNILNYFIQLHIDKHGTNRQKFFIDYISIAAHLEKLSCYYVNFNRSLMEEMELVKELIFSKADTRLLLSYRRLLLESSNVWYRLYDEELFDNIEGNLSIRNDIKRLIKIGKENLWDKKHSSIHLDIFRDDFYWMELEAEKEVKDGIIKWFAMEDGKRLPLNTYENDREMIKNKLVNNITLPRNLKVYGSFLIFLSKQEDNISQMELTRFHMNDEIRNREMELIKFIHHSNIPAFLISGEIGSGKSSFVKYFANKLRRNLIQIQMHDSLDINSLISTYRFNESSSNEIQVVNGILVDAMEKGKIVLIENVNYANESIISFFLHLMRQMREYENVSNDPHNAYEEDRCYGRRYHIHPEFMLFFTIDKNEMKIENRNNLLKFLMKELPLINVSDHLVPGFEDGGNLEKYLEEFIGRMFRRLKRIGGVLSRVFLQMKEIIGDNRKRNYRRQYTFRDIIRSCNLLMERIETNKIVDIDCREYIPLIYIVLLSVYVGHLGSCDEERLIVQKRIGTILQIDFHQFDVLENYSLVTNIHHVCDECSAYQMNEEEVKTETFVEIGESLRLLQHLNVCIQLNETALIVGETGCGKTTCIKYLASQFHQKLVTINMSHDVESQDLIGFYRPTEILSILKRIFDQYLKWFNIWMRLATYLDQRTRITLSKKVVSTLNHVHDWLCENFEKVTLHNFHTFRQRLRFNLEIILLLMERDENNQKIVHNLIDQLKKISYGKLNNNRRHIFFEYQIGILTTAIENGHWILFDEINMASNETLQVIIPLLEMNERLPSITLFERGDEKPLKRHENFRMFATMNPSSDVVKKELPPVIHQKFFEHFMTEPTGKKDLEEIVSSYLKYLNSDRRDPIVEKIVDIYQTIKRRSKHVTVCLRNLCRSMRSFASFLKHFTIKQSLFHSLQMAFVTSTSDELIRKEISSLINSTIADLPLHFNLFLRKDDKYLNEENYEMIEGFPLRRVNDRNKITDNIINELLNRNTTTTITSVTPMQHIITESVRRNVEIIARSIFDENHYPMLLEGETSVGKTSVITFIANKLGRRLTRINNHQFIDVQDYVGSYSLNVNGSMKFNEGALIQAMKNGDWILLDELNLAPAAVLESLNCLLDENKELTISETGEIVKAHSDFMLFGTQNPAARYGGRKQLSRAFRNRFIELNIYEPPSLEIVEILEKRWNMPKTYARLLVKVSNEIEKHRSKSGIDAGMRHGLVTLRDLFRWANRYRLGDMEWKIDWKQYLADHGMMLLGERCREKDDREMIRQILEKTFSTKLSDDHLYGKNAKSNVTKNIIKKCLKILKDDGIKSEFQLSLTKNLLKTIVLSIVAMEYQEPILLVGETGIGKTSICQWITSLYYNYEKMNNKLDIINCHLNSETSDFIGTLRPSRGGKHLFEWYDGILVRCMENGYHLLIDEISLAEDAVIERINSVLEPERTIYLTEKFHATQEMIDDDNDDDDDDDDDIGKKRNAEDDNCEGEKRIRLNDPSSNQDKSDHSLNNQTVDNERIVEEKYDHMKIELKAKKSFRLYATMNPAGDYGKKELSTALRNRFTEIWMEESFDIDEYFNLASNRLVRSLTRLPKGTHDRFTRMLVDFWMEFKEDKNNLLATTTTTITLRDFVNWIRNAIGIYERKTDPLFGNAQSIFTGIVDSFMITIGYYIGTDYYTNRLEELTKQFVINHPRAKEKKIYLSYLTRQSMSIFSPQFNLTFPIRQQLKSNVFDFTNETAQRNLRRLIKCISVEGRAILIEGPPGTGKTASIERLGSLMDIDVRRINLSNQTELSDLFGSDLPNIDEEMIVNSQEQSKELFKWIDGPMLAGMKKGDWILLDEMNLASQAVLEGLNSCLDHRGEVYISELDRIFKINSRSRIFATQNSAETCIGRKHLPKSFLNRFMKLYFEQYQISDMKQIVEIKYGKKNKFDLFNIIPQILQHFPSSLYHINIRDVEKFAVLPTTQLSEQQLIILLKYYLSNLFNVDCERVIDEIFPTYANHFQMILYHSPLNLIKKRKDKYYLMKEEEEEGENEEEKQLKSFDIFNLPYWRLPNKLDSNFIQILTIFKNCLSSFPNQLYTITSDLFPSVIRSLRILSTHFHINLLSFVCHSEMEADDLFGTYEQYNLNRTLNKFLDNIFLRQRSQSILKEELRDLRQTHRYSSNGKMIREKLICIDQIIKSEFTSLRKAFERMKKTFQIDLNTFQSDEYNMDHLKGKFQFEESKFLEMVRKGGWVIMEHANLCSPSFIDRLNSLFETKGELIINENIGTYSIRAHSNFHLFLLIHPDARNDKQLSAPLISRSIQLKFCEELNEEKSIIAKHYQSLLTNEKLFHILQRNFSFDVSDVYDKVIDINCCEILLKEKRLFEFVYFYLFDDDIRLKGNETVTNIKLSGFSSILINFLFKFYEEIRVDKLFFEYTIDIILIRSYFQSKRRHPILHDIYRFLNLYLVYRLYGARYLHLSMFRGVDKIDRHYNILMNYMWEEREEENGQFHSMELPSYNEPFNFQTNNDEKNSLECYFKFFIIIHRLKIKSYELSIESLIELIYRTRSSVYLQSLRRLLNEYLKYLKNQNLLDVNRMKSSFSQYFPSEYSHFNKWTLMQTIIEFNRFDISQIEKKKKLQQLDIMPMDDFNRFSLDIIRKDDFLKMIHKKLFETMKNGELSKNIKSLPMPNLLEIWKADFDTLLPNYVFVEIVKKYAYYQVDEIKEKLLNIYETKGKLRKSIDMERCEMLRQFYFKDNNNNNNNNKKNKDKKENSEDMNSDLSFHRLTITDIECEKELNFDIIKLSELIPFDEFNVLYKALSLSLSNNDDVQSNMKRFVLPVIDRLMAAYDLSGLKSLIYYQLHIIAQWRLFSRQQRRMMHNTLIYDGNVLSAKLNVQLLIYYHSEISPNSNFLQLEEMRHKFLFRNIYMNLMEMKQKGLTTFHHLDDETDDGIMDDEIMSQTMTINDGNFGEENISDISSMDEEIWELVKNSAQLMMKSQKNRKTIMEDMKNLKDIIALFSLYTLQQQRKNMPNKRHVYMSAFCMLQELIAMTKQTNEVRNSFLFLSFKRILIDPTTYHQSIIERNRSRYDGKKRNSAVIDVSERLEKLIEQINLKVKELLEVFVDDSRLEEMKRNFCEYFHRKRSIPNILVCATLLRKHVIEFNKNVSAKRSFPTIIIDQLRRITIQCRQLELDDLKNILIETENSTHIFALKWFPMLISLFTIDQLACRSFHEIKTIIFDFITNSSVGEYRQRVNILGMLLNYLNYLISEDDGDKLERRWKILKYLRKFVRILYEFHSYNFIFENNVQNYRTLSNSFDVKLKSQIKILSSLLSNCSISDNYRSTITKCFDVQREYGASLKEPIHSIRWNWKHVKKFDGISFLNQFKFVYYLSRDESRLMVDYLKYEREELNLKEMKELTISLLNDYGDESGEIRRRAQSFQKERKLKKFDEEIVEKEKKDLARSANHLQQNFQLTLKQLLDNLFKFKLSYRKGERLLHQFEKTSLTQLIFNHQTLHQLIIERELKKKERKFPYVHQCEELGNSLLNLEVILLNSIFNNPNLRNNRKKEKHNLSLKGSKKLIHQLTSYLIHFIDESFKEIVMMDELIKRWNESKKHFHLFNLIISCKSVRHSYSTEIETKIFDKFIGQLIELQTILQFDNESIEQTTLLTKLDFFIEFLNDVQCQLSEWNVLRMSNKHLNFMPYLIRLNEKQIKELNLMREMKEIDIIQLLDRTINCGKKYFEENIINSIKSNFSYLTYILEENSTNFLKNFPNEEEVMECLIHPTLNEAEILFRCELQSISNIWRKRSEIGREDLMELMELNNNLSNRYGVEKFYVKFLKLSLQHPQENYEELKKLWKEEMDIFNAILKEHFKRHCEKRELLNDLIKFIIYSNEEDICNFEGIDLCLEEEKQQQQQQQQQSGDDGSETEPSGMGDIQDEDIMDDGTKNVSDEIQCEEEIEGLRNDDKDKPNEIDETEEKDENGDSKENGIEMTDDFDVPDEMKDEGELDEETTDQEKNELENQEGEVNDQEEILDKNLFPDIDDNNEDDNDETKKEKENKINEKENDDDDNNNDDNDDDNEMNENEMKKKDDEECRKDENTNNKMRNDGRTNENDDNLGNDEPIENDDDLNKDELTENVEEDKEEEMNNDNEGESTTFSDDENISDTNENDKDTIMDEIDDKDDSKEHQDSDVNDEESCENEEDNNGDFDTPPSDKKEEMKGEDDLEISTELEKRNEHDDTEMTEANEAINENNEKCEESSAAQCANDSNELDNDEDQNGDNDEKEEEKFISSKSGKSADEKDDDDKNNNEEDSSNKIDENDENNQKEDDLQYETGESISTKQEGDSSNDPNLERKPHQKKKNERNDREIIEENQSTMKKEEINEENIKNENEKSNEDNQTRQGKRMIDDDEEENVGESEEMMEDGRLDYDTFCSILDSYKQIDSIENEKNIEKFGNDLNSKNSNHNIIDDDNVVNNEKKLNVKVMNEHGPLLWKAACSTSRHEATELAERLKIILQPDVFSKFEGDYRSGKRLNMKRLVSFVASDYRNDRIWLRRRRPDRLQRHMIIAVDDSLSMKETECQVVAYQSIALLAQTAMFCDIGRFGIVSFGEHVHQLHKDHMPFSMNDGIKVFSQLSFNDNQTNYNQLLNESIELFDDSSSSGNDRIENLLIILSDGRGINPNQLKSSIEKLNDRNVFILFIVLDQREKNADNCKMSILDLNTVSYDEQRNMKIEKYIDKFPFDNYIVVNDYRKVCRIISNSVEYWCRRLMNI
ncbi:hypothetical protein SNEBB_009765 [Seison nebaliae]|nr:hypothetical protein SNEBB_009765 [Seison nebaliae]